VQFLARACPLTPTTERETMKLDTEHYTLHDDGTVTGRDGRTYMVPSAAIPGRVRLYAGYGISFDSYFTDETAAINAAFVRRGIRPPYVP
jgi:hypothetical protein